MRMFDFMVQENHKYGVSSIKRSKVTKTELRWIYNKDKIDYTSSKEIITEIVIIIKLI